jgi:hypothetical protein
MVRINGVRDYTETCKYEANKIHIRLIRFKLNFKKNCECGTPYSDPVNSYRK